MELTGLALYRESCVPALTQERLASLAGVHVNTVYAWERSGVMTASRLLALARLFAQLGVITDGQTALAFWEACRGKPLVPPPELRSLAGLPPSVPADIGPPPCSLLPLYRNPRFIGRQRELEELATALAHPHAVVAIVGMGGAGKSQLASEYSYRFGQRYPGGVFWLSFADPERIPEAIARCGAADALDLDPAFAQLPLERQVQMVRTAWREPVPRLLIFDTCEEAALLHEWRPVVGGCRVLVTSRLRAWPPTLLSRQIRFSGLERAESIELLYAYLSFAIAHQGAAETETLDRLSALLDDTPLALHLAGSYLAQQSTTYSPATLVGALEADPPMSHPSLSGGELSLIDGPAHLRAVLHRSYQLLLTDRPRERLARDLLLHAACFMPGEPIAHDLLLETVSRATALQPEALPSLEDALALVIGQSLLEGAPGGMVRLHRLVAAFLRDLPDYPAAHHAVCQALAQALYAREARYAPVQPHDLAHLRAIAWAAQVRDDDEAADLNRTAAFQFWLHRRPDAEPLLAWAASTYERVLGPSHPKVADALSLLGLDLQTRSRWIEARLYHERALTIRAQALGERHPETAAAYNNLGYLLCWLADYPTARAYLRRGMRVRAACFGLMHSDTARSIHNMGYLLLRMGRFASAKRFLTLALRIREHVLPAQQTATALSLSLLGEASTRLGHLAEAILLQEQAIVMWRSLLGDAHPHVAEGLYRLAETQAADGRLEQATTTLEHARAIHQHCLTDELGVVEGIRVVERLGVVLARRHAPDAARPLVESALAGWRRLFGEEHPHTARAYYHLGVLAWSDGQGDIAVALAQRALTSQMHLLGPRHPDTAETVALLAQISNLSSSSR